MDSINTINEKSILQEQNAVGLTEKKEWFLCKKEKIKIYRGHRILIRQRHFESLANEILFSKDLPQSAKENMRHEKVYNEIAGGRYYNVMGFYLNHDVQL